MELVAEAAVSASVGFLLGKISTYLTEKKDSDFDKLLHKLETKFLSLNAVLTDAEQKQVRNPQVKKWLDKLEDAVDEARDLFDDIEYDALKLKVKPESKAGKSKVRNFIPTIFDSTDGKRKTVRKRRSEMEQILEKLNNFAEQSRVLGLEKGAVREKLSQRLPSTSLMERSELYGRNADKAAIMEYLLMPDAAGQEICVIPIVGMGGVGKTTLAQAIFNDKEVEKHFELRAWVCVSDEFDACKVTRIILKEVGLEASNDTDLNSLQVKLKKRLTGQRFLIVLDDVWNELYDDWKELKKPFDHGAQGSKIIVTSRSDKVASIMRTLPTHHLKQLEDEECWQIFAKHASRGNSEYFTQNSNLERIGREIVKKCKGLPLAATTLGGLLRSTSDVGEWNRIANSEFWELPSEQSNILPALRLSYHYLPSHLKRCFVFCSMFPKDYKFEKEELVSLWMAENLLEHRIKKNMKMEEVGDEYFNDLVSRSFFQHLSTYESRFVMHDLMVDLAKFVSRKMYFLAEEGKSNEIELIKQAHHIVYDGRCNKSHEIFKSISEATCLRTLLPLFSSSSVEVPLHDLLKLRHLRYLSLYGYGKINELPESIGDLRYIRYLDLSWTSIKVLPESLCRLYNLQTLKLSGCCNLTKLPKDLGCLISLRYLDVSHSPIVEMPTNLSKLINVYNCQMLTNLPSLLPSLIELSISDCPNLASPFPMMPAVTKVNVSNCQRLTDLPSLLPSLIKLSISDCPNLASPLPMMPAVTKVNVSNCQRLTDLPSLLPSLIQLSISNCPNLASSLPMMPRVTEVRLSSCQRLTDLPSLLPSLIVLSISSCPELASSLPMMPRVTEVRLSSCQRLTNLPSLLPSLIVLSISSCPELASPLPMMPVVTKVKLYKCQRLTDLPSLLPSLIELSISDCPNLASPLPMMPVVTEVNVSNCQRLTNLPSLLPSLIKLSIYDCPRLASSLPMMPAVTKVNVSNCQRLTNLPSLLPSLIKLSIEKCPELASSLPVMPAVTEVRLFRCQRLAGFQVTGSFNFPQNMEISDSFDPTTFRCFYASLRNLYIEDCNNFEFPAHQTYESLEDLEIDFSCDSTTSFRLDSFPNIKNLKIEGCIRLEFFTFSPNSDLRYLTLTRLQLWSCEKLKFLPEQLNTLLPCLEYLYTRGCSELESFPRSGLPSSLHYLKISDCDKLIASRKNWNLQALPNLTYFSINGYKGEDMESFPEQGLLPTTITELRIEYIDCIISLDDKGFQQLTFLEKLSIELCPKLQTLPKEGLPTSLQSVTIYKCPLLEKKYEREIREYWYKTARSPHIRNC